MEVTRECRKCKEEKDLSSSYGKYTSTSGATLWRRTCNLCRSAQESKRYAENPEVRERMRKSARAYGLMREYGLTVEEYEDILASQEGTCEICKKVPSRKLNIDHCYKTGKIRGLLCWSCNVGIGHLKDNPAFLRNAAAYLEKNL